MKVLKETNFDLYDLSKFELNKTNVKNHIVFKESNHSYTNVLTDKRYTSVTSLLSKFESKFVPDKWNTKKTMTDLNMTYEEVIDYWDRLNRFSQVKGSYVHYAIEKYLKENLSIQDMQLKYDLSKEVLNYLKFVKRLKIKEKLFLCEDLLYSDEYEIAGQSDIVVLNAKTIDIYDWKTSDDELKREGYNNKKLIYPLDEVPAGKLSKYELQLSIYMFFAEKMYGLKAGKMFICNFRNGKIDKIKVNYQKDLVKKLLDYEKYDKN